MNGVFGLARLAAMCFLIYIVAMAALFVFGVLVHVTVFLFKWGVIVAGVVALVALWRHRSAYRDWLALRRQEPRIDLLPFAVRQDIHLLSQLGFTGQLEEVLRKHGLNSEGHLVRARAYLKCIQEEEVRLDLLGEQRAGSVWRPASDAQELLPFTGAVKLKELKLTDTEQTFTVVDEAGDIHTLFDWQANYLTALPERVMLTIDSMN